MGPVVPMVPAHRLHEAATLILADHGDKRMRSCLPRPLRHPQDSSLATSRPRRATRAFHYPAAVRTTNDISFETSGSTVIAGAGDTSSQTGLGGNACRMRTATAVPLSGGLVVGKVIASRSRIRRAGRAGCNRRLACQIAALRPGVCQDRADGGLGDTETADSPPAGTCRRTACECTCFGDRSPSPSKAELWGARCRG